MKLLSVFMAILVTYLEEITAESDPCLQQNHMLLPNLGSRNSKCVPSKTDLSSILCDLYLTPGWYRAENGIIANRPPDTGTCGVAIPVWMIDPFGDIKVSEVVNRSVCIQKANTACQETFKIKIKNCTSFYIYYLHSLQECTSAYCFDSSLPCFPPTTTTMTKTTFLSATSRIPDDKGNLKTPDNAALIVGLAVGCTVCVILSVVAAVVIIKHQNKLHHGQVNDMQMKRSDIQAPPPPYQY